MPYTKCPTCRKVQQVTPALLMSEVGCMNDRCRTEFKADEYRMHSGPLSRAMFFAVILFALFMLCRWVWDHAARIISLLG